MIVENDSKGEKYLEDVVSKKIFLIFFLNFRMNLHSLRNKIWAMVASLDPKLSTL
jgi:hypothetical protein